MTVEVTMDEVLDAPSVSLETAKLGTGSMKSRILELPWKFDLGAECLAETRDFMLPDTFATIACATMHPCHAIGTGHRFECYGPVRVFKAGHFVDICLTRRPFLSRLRRKPRRCRHLRQKHELGRRDAA